METRDTMDFNRNKCTDAIMQNVLRILASVKPSNHDGFLKHFSEYYGYIMIQHNPVFNTKHSPPTYKR